MNNVYKELVKTSYQDTQCLLMTRAILPFRAGIPVLTMVLPYFRCTYRDTDGTYSSLIGV